MRVTHMATFDDLGRGADDKSSAPVASPNEEQRLIAYLKDLGFVVATSADVLNAIKVAQDEEELAAHQCVEGIAVSHASDGWWLLFPRDCLDAEPPVRDGTEATNAGSGDDAC